MWRILFVGLFVLLSACQQEEPQPDFGLEGYDPHLIENQRAACAKSGGRFGQGGLTGTFVCYENMDDANKSCRSANDCDGVCLARSMTCSPVNPLFGCNEVLTKSGQRTKVCLN